jgi:hypothetical protein
MSAFKTWLYAFHSVKGPLAFMLGPLSRKLTGTEISGALKDKFYSVAFFVQLPAIYLFAFFYAKNGQEVLTAYCVAFACGYAVTKVLEKMSSQTTPSFSGYVLRFIMIFAIGIALSLALFWLTTKYFGYHPWYMLLIGLVILLLSLGLIKIGSDSGSEVAQIGIKLLGFIGGFIGSSLLYAWVILLGVCINLLPLFGIVWIGSFYMESLKDHVMY